MSRKLRLCALRLRLMLTCDAATRRAIEVRIAILEGNL